MLPHQKNKKESPCPYSKPRSISLKDVKIQLIFGSPAKTTKKLATKHEKHNLLPQMPKNNNKKQLQIL